MLKMKVVYLKIDYEVIYLNSVYIWQHVTLQISEALKTPLPIAIKQLDNPLNLSKKLMTIKIQFFSEV